MNAVPQIGDKVQFTYPNFASCIGREGIPAYATHSGQIVTIIAIEEEAFTDGDGNACRGYRIEADDGWVGLAWPGEINHPWLNEQRKLL